MTKPAIILLALLAGCDVKTESGTLENHAKKRIHIMCPSEHFHGYIENINGAVVITDGRDGSVLEHSEVCAWTVHKD